MSLALLSGSSWGLESAWYIPFCVCVRVCMCVCVCICAMTVENYRLLSSNHDSLKVAVLQNDTKGEIMSSLQLQVVLFA